MILPGWVSCTSISKALCPSEEGNKHTKQCSQNGGLNLVQSSPSNGPWGRRREERRYIYTIAVMCRATWRATLHPSILVHLAATYTVRDPIWVVFKDESSSKEIIKEVSSQSIPKAYCIDLPVVKQPLPSYLPRTNPSSPRSPASKQRPIPSIFLAVLHVCTQFAPSRPYIEHLCQPRASKFIELFAEVEDGLE